jgi:hypothetical protein
MTKAVPDMPYRGHREVLGNACVLKGSSQRLVDQFMLIRLEVGDGETVL